MRTHTCFVSGVRIACSPHLCLTAASCTDRRKPRAMDLKAHIDSLAAQREALEAEMAHHSQRLEAAGVGLHSSLVDAQARMAPAGRCPVLCLLLTRCLRQGFPLADVDVAAARADRHALFTLANDHKALTEELHRSLEALHALRREQSSSAGTSAQAADPLRATPAPAASHAAPLANGAPHARPFAVVDSVAPSSPASWAGVRVRPWSAALTWWRGCL